MTTYLITEAQRQQCIDSHLNNAVAILQSLPVVKMPLKNYDVDHANYYYHIRIAELEEQLADAKKGSEPAAMVVGKDAQKSYAISTGLTVGTVLFTSPQTLTPITADDVSDKTVIDLWRIGVLTSTGTQGKEIAAKVYNAVIKHKVTK